MTIAIPPILSFEEFEAETEAMMRPQKERRFGRLSIGEIATRKIVPPDFVIDGWMIAKEQSFLAGESQSGKSFLALHAAMCVATGRDVLGRKTKPGLVIYQAGESGAGVTDLRIPAWCRRFGDDLDLATVPFEILPARVNLFRPDGNVEEFHQTIANIAAEWKDRADLRLVVIDTLSKAMSGANENDGRDVNRVLDNCERISRDTGAHVCIVHHLPKNGTGMRGHGSLKGDVDSVVLVSMDEAKIRTVAFDKVKDGEAGGKLKFKLKQVVLGEREDKELITSCIVLPVDEEEHERAEQDKYFRIDGQRRDTFLALWEALLKHGEPAPPALGLPFGTIVVRASYWREQYRAIDPAHPQDDDAQKQAERANSAMKRHGPPLLSHGVIGRNNPWVWWTGKLVGGFPHKLKPLRNITSPEPQQIEREPEIDDDNVL